jgi:hypothetical protein
VGAVFGSEFTDSGYHLTASGLPPGAYDVVVYAHSSVTGTFNNSQRVQMTVLAGPTTDPAMAIDAPASGATRTQPFTIAGWAIDRGAPSGAGVDAIHVWAWPSGGGPPLFVGAATYGAARPDVGALFGSRFTNSGYGLTASGLPPGTYDIVVYAHSTVTGEFNNSQRVAMTVQ